MFKKCSKHKTVSNQSLNDCHKTEITFNRLQNNFKYFLLNLLLIILLSDNYFVLLVNSQIVSNVIDINAFDGGLITGHKVLTLKDSPYYVFKDIVVDSKSKLVIESGVTIHFNHSIGVQVFGTLIAKVCHQKRNIIISFATKLISTIIWFLCPFVCFSPYF